jgi:hypothetical protein
MAPVRFGRLHRPPGSSNPSASKTKELLMSDKSPHKSNTKKSGRTLKEKRAAKKARKADKPTIPPTTG